MNKVQIIIIYLLGINLLGFMAMGIDKFKAKRGNWRIPEDTLFSFTFLRWWCRNNCRDVRVSS